MFSFQFSMELFGSFLKEINTSVDQSGGPLINSIKIYFFCVYLAHLSLFSVQCSVFSVKSFFSLSTLQQFHMTLYIFLSDINTT